MLELAKTAMRLNFPVTQDGKPNDAVFKVLANILAASIACSQTHVVESWSAKGSVV
jgi:hypothetical protein